MLGNKAKDKKVDIKKQYFAEANAWDLSIWAGIKKSERNAWIVASSFGMFLLIALASIALMMPFKTTEPYVIRVDNNTGLTDVVNVLRAQDIDATHALNRYWLSQYINYREGYLWDTRAYNRRFVGLMSTPEIQEQYAQLTNPTLNENAPVNIYGDSISVNPSIINMTELNDGEIVDGENRYTYIVRFTKEVDQASNRYPVTHWAATIVFTFRNLPTNVNDRDLNPLGFQVISYIVNEESEVQS